MALLRQVQAGEWMVDDREAGGPRAATLQDVAVLSRTRTGLSALLPALEEAAIPHRAESRTLVYDAQEVRDLIVVLRAIDDPTDEVALVAALRSSAFACGDDDLLRYRAGGGRWDYRPQPPTSLPPSDPVVSALRWLRDLHERRWWVPLPRLVDTVLAERQFLALALVDRRPRERWQRLRYVADQARGFAESPDATLRGLIAWLEWQASERAQVQDRVVPEADDDAVRLMTTHSSKGLQFPIVVLLGLDSNNSTRTTPVLWDDAGTPQVCLAGTVQMAGYEGAQATEKLLNGFESERLLYVAMTRAQDHLVLSCFHASPDAPRARRTTATAIAEFAEEHPDLCRHLAPDVATAPAPGAAAPGGPTPTGDADLEQPGDRERWIEDRQALIAAQRVRVSVSATAVARELAAEPMPEADAGFEKETPTEETPPWRRGRAGTSIGRAVHSVLQTVDLASGADLEAIASAQATAEGVPDRVAEVTRLARVALESQAVRDAVASGRYWREVYAAVEVDGVIVDGFIDLLYESPEGYVVVDYKTDSIGSHNVDAVLDRYRPQGETYALILQSQLTRPVVRCDFVFVSAPGGAVVKEIAVTVERLDALRAQIAALA